MRMSYNDNLGCHEFSVTNSTWQLFERSREGSKSIETDFSNVASSESLREAIGVKTAGTELGWIV